MALDSKRTLWKPDGLNCDPQNAYNMHLRSHFQTMASAGSKIMLQMNHGFIKDI